MKWSENASANTISTPFSAEFSTPLGLVANPLLSNDDTLIANYANSASYGTVICGWQLAFAAEG